MPDNFKLDVKGDEELLRAFNNTPAIQSEVTQAVQKGQAVVHQRAATYPPAPPNSTYRRTRRLGNSWDIEPVQMLGGEVKGFVTNPTEYGGYVHNPATEQPPQAQVHQGRWATTVQILAEKKAQIDGFFEAAKAAIVVILGGGR